MFDEWGEEKHDGQNVNTSGYHGHASVEAEGVKVKHCIM